MFIPWASPRSAVNRFLLAVSRSVNSGDISCIILHSESSVTARFTSLALAPKDSRKPVRYVPLSTLIMAL